MMQMDAGGNLSLIDIEGREKKKGVAQILYARIYTVGRELLSTT